MKEENEEELIRECIKGNGVYQKRLYNLYSSKMYAVCLRYSKDEDQAKDLLQEGFIKLFNNLPKYRGDGSFEGWIRRIFVNTSIENYRKEQRRGNSVEVEDVEGELKIDSTSFQKFGYEELMKLVQQLPLGYKTVFNMYVIEGYSHKEIAEQLGVTESTSKTQLHKARLLLQKSVLELDEYSSGRK